MPAAEIARNTSIDGVMIELSAEQYLVCHMPVNDKYESTFLVTIAIAISCKEETA